MPERKGNEKLKRKSSIINLQIAVMLKIGDMAKR